MSSNSEKKQIAEVLGLNSIARVKINYSTAYSPSREYKRRVCLKFKDNSSCSNTQLKVYKHKKRVGDDINAVTAKRRCRQCTGGNVTELQWQGRCGLVLAIGQFYGQARRAGGSQWRKACSAWKEAQEPDVTTAPATAADVALDEQESKGLTLYLLNNAAVSALPVYSTSPRIRPKISPLGLVGFGTSALFLKLGAL
ncbi:hypothetical protein V8E51_005978 [Hyaloscypha variabilis]